MEFFTTSTGTLLAAEKAAGVGITSRSPSSASNRPQNIPYFAAKVAQEKLIRESARAVPLVHATQFFEFLGSIADVSMVDGSVHLPGAPSSSRWRRRTSRPPSRALLQAPRRATSRWPAPSASASTSSSARLAFRKDPRVVVRDDDATYYGAHIEESTLLPVEGAQIFETRLDEMAAAEPAAELTRGRAPARGALPSHYGRRVERGLRR